MIRNNEQPIKVTKDFFWDFGVRYYKIILTTDQDLIKDGIQAIDDEFLEWFVKNPSCEEVETYSLKEGNEELGYYHYKYEIIIPQEEPKQDRTCTNNCSVVCGECQILELKQETLEEVAENHKINTIKSGRTHRVEYTEQIKFDFIAGAKWQAERMYSEEEVVGLLYRRSIYQNHFESDSEIRLWFEKFKKK